MMVLAGVIGLVINNVVSVDAWSGRSGPEFPDTVTCYGRFFDTERVRDSELAVRSQR